MDLPEPDSPTRPKVSPFVMEKETSSTALTTLADVLNIDRFIRNALDNEVTVKISSLMNDHHYEKYIAHSAQWYAL